MIATAQHFKLANEKQRNFVRALATEREMPAEVSEKALEAADRGDLTSAEATKLIDAFYHLPRKAKAVDASKWAHKDGLIKCNYAVPTAELPEGLRGRFVGHNKLGFVRVNVWKGRTYVDRLTGTPGAFTRSRFDLDVEKAVCGLIRADAARYAKLFADTYTVCARCGAELTEDDSVAAGMGPTCRGYFGL